jgi:hypothetical protein
MRTHILLSIVIVTWSAQVVYADEVVNAPCEKVLELPDCTPKQPCKRATDERECGDNPMCEAAKAAQNATYAESRAACEASKAAQKAHCEAARETIEFLNAQRKAACKKTH